MSRQTLSFSGLIEGLAGAVLVGVVLSDVFRSVILPRATRQSLQLGPVLGAMMLRLWLRWARRRTGPKQALGAFGPLLLVTEMLAWVVLLILGYSMLLHATGGLQPRDTFGDALYAAASVFVTTGLSGQEAATGPARIVVAVAGFSGLAVVTLTVTFLLSIQTALLRREALVLRLRARVGSRPSGLVVLETLSRMGRPGDAGLVEFFAQWEGWAADVLLTHRAFPILVYFRSTDEDCGWMAALWAVLDAAALVAITGHDDAGEHALVCHRMGARLIADLARQFGIRAPLEAGLEREAFEAGLERLLAAGHGGVGNVDLAWPEFQALRCQHFPPLQAMATRFGEGEAEW